jgi:hypothetical protein
LCPIVDAFASVGLGEFCLVAKFVCEGNGLFCSFLSFQGIDVAVEPVCEIIQKIEPCGVFLCVSVQRILQGIELTLLRQAQAGKDAYEQNYSRHGILSPDWEQMSNGSQ